MPHQIVGARFLADRPAALLADEQRVGKTAAAIIAADYIFAGSILVVTKGSARANWGREVREWQSLPRSVQVLYAGHEKITDAAVVVVGWGMVYDKRVLKALLARNWDVLILDESHEAKNPEAKRTKAVYGSTLAPNLPHAPKGLIERAGHTWSLSGTPVPNAPNDLFPMLRAMAPARLAADEAKNWPDVSTYDRFVKRFCVVRPKFINGRRIDVIVAGKNLEELNARLEGFWLRRTQQDVGIGKPLFSLFTVTAGDYGSDALKEALEEIGPRAAAILEAAETGSRLDAEDEMHLGTLRRVTGEIKAHAVVEAIKDELDDGLDRIVLMAWHTNVIETLREGLQAYGVVVLDGRTLPTKRQTPVDMFTSGLSRVFIGQIQAAGEAIDLSASCNLMFVEPSFIPKDMSQAALRITNHTQKRQALVRVCALEGSIDEALMRILTRKVSTIKQIMES